ncbi:GTPase family protein [Propionicicella superfundia]|uniref:GTPase family protein n=1 Tax=Propionicicella superfundia TaxID=348582 RepID=UPI0004221921|nr:GTPase [Propionicicella superfundia]
MTQWFTESFRSEFEKQASQLGRFNLALFGKTGVGKSTLVNAVFGADVAATGVGAPVTLTSHLYLDTRGTLGLVDTRGLEIGKDDKELVAELTKVVRDMRKQRLEDQIHVAWYCVRGLDRRFEDAEAAFIRKLDELGIPVILVMTQVPMRDGLFHPDALELARQIEQRNLPIVENRVFMTFARRDQFTGQSPYGLMELLRATFLVAPDAVHGALAAAQTIDMAAKARAARAHIGATVAGAGAAAASPIPFSAAAILVPLQLAMMGRIAQLYNIKFEKAALLAIASTSAATSLGRTTVANLVKLVPGAGTVAGGVINAGVASTFTYAMGEAWLAVCQRASGGKLPMVNGVVDSKAVRDLFMTEFGKRLPSIKRPEDAPR